MGSSPSKFRRSVHDNTKEGIKPFCFSLKRPSTFKNFPAKCNVNHPSFYGRIPEISSNDVTKSSHRIGLNLTKGNSLAGHTIVLSVNILSVNSTGYPMAESVQGKRIYRGHFRHGRISLNNFKTCFAFS